MIAVAAIVLVNRRSLLCMCLSLRGMKVDTVALQ
jgi:hypothetical protein